MLLLVLGTPVLGYRDYTIVDKRSVSRSPLVVPRSSWNDFSVLSRKVRERPSSRLLQLAPWPVGEKRGCIRL